MTLGYDGMNVTKDGVKSGSINKLGYVQVYVDGKLQYAHRMIWEMINGPIPIGMVIDHINHIRSDNRIENLRLVTRKGNQRNMKLLNNNTSGMCGVSFNARKGKWRARFKRDGKERHLGYFDSKDDAIAARQAANVKYGFHENHGDKL